MSDPVSILIPAFNQLDYCRACIESVQANTAPPYRLILVDNGSTDGVGAYFDTVKDAVVLHAGENLGFAGGVNLGLSRAEGHVVLLNSDTLAPPGWLERLTAALLSGGKVGLAGPVSNHAAGPQQVAAPPLPDADAVARFAAERAASHAGQHTDTTRLIGFCLMIRDRVLAEVGNFDERFAIGNYEDDDYCTRVRQAGYGLVVAEDCFVFHHGGKTFAGMGLEGERFEALMRENRERYMDKWDIKLPEGPAPEARAARLGEQAQDALARGNAGEAVRLLREAVHTAPHVARHHNDLGVVVWQAGRQEMALGFFKQALAVDPGYAEARDNLRDAAQALGVDVTAFEESLGNPATIYFPCPDFAEPAGGIRKIYRHVDILHGAGIPAKVLHFGRGFRCAWFENDTPATSVEECLPRPMDTLCVPEIHMSGLTRQFPGTPYVVLNQNAYNTFNCFSGGLDQPYHYDGALAIIVVSEDNEDYLRLCFPRVPVLRKIYSLDPALFYHDPAVKRRQIAYMPRKNAGDADQVTRILALRGLDVPFVRIEGVSEAEAARMLRESMWFMSFGHPEGFGLPPAEAMACGCVVVGYHGFGGKEFLKPPHAFPVDFGDIVTYVRTMEQVVQEDPAVRGAEAAAFVGARYTVEAERASVLDIWRTVLALPRQPVTPG